MSTSFPSPISLDFRCIIRLFPLYFKFFQVPEQTGREGATMSISDRYRQLAEEIQDFLLQMQAEIGGEKKQVRLVEKAVHGLDELREQVGEIPRIRLEAELTPVLLKAHGNLDRARLLFEEEGGADLAAATWDMEQKIYRLLNDL